MNNSKNFLIGSVVGFLVSIILYVVGLCLFGNIALNIIIHLPVFFVLSKITELFHADGIIVFVFDFLLYIPIGGLMGVLLGVIKRRVKRGAINSSNKN